MMYSTVKSALLETHRDHENMFLNRNSLHTYSELVPWLLVSWLRLGNEKQFLITDSSYKRVPYKRTLL